MAQTRRPNTRKEHEERVGIAHGPAWNTLGWYVPFEGDHAVIYHGHEDPNDHSDCGPQIFCCPKAVGVLLKRYPNEDLANAEWQFTDGQHIASWMGRDGPRVYYFFFCDPDDANAIYFVGIAAPEVRDVLLKRMSLDRYVEKSDRICNIDG